MGLHCFPFTILQLSMSLNACLDIKWSYLVFLSLKSEHALRDMNNSKIMEGKQGKPI